MTDVDSRESAAAPAQPDRGRWLEVLVDAARSGREDAIAQIVAELSPLLWQVARAAGLSTSDAEDVLQTVWLRLLTHLDDIHTSSALTAWLVTTTRREAWRVRGTGRRQFPADQDWLDAIPDQRPGAEDLAVAADLRRELWAALGQLPPQCQELLRIVAFVPRPDYDVVAATLGMPRGSIGPTRGRCLAKLRAILASSAEGNPR
jgi:RNA polymerase sigma factor (sigma-70 family)